jgi:hypothetical protein
MNVPCVQFKARDKVNKVGTIKMLNFYGTLKVKNEEKVWGFFEYFMDSRYTLFHRMFYPLRQIKGKKLEKFVKNLPKSIMNEVYNS